jgi:hypothetical protein
VVSEVVVPRRNKNSGDARRGKSCHDGILASRCVSRNLTPAAAADGWITVQAVAN